MSTIEGFHCTRNLVAVWCSDSPFRLATFARNYQVAVWQHFYITPALLEITSRLRSHAVDVSTRVDKLLFSFALVGGVTRDRRRW